MGASAPNAADRRHVVIIGGAAGIGAATAELLAGRGWLVTVADIDATNGAQTARRVGGRFLACDVVSEASVIETTAAAEAVAPVFGLVVCAAVFEELGRAESASPDGLDLSYQVNYRGAFFATRAFARAMALRGRGAIVHVASFGGMASSPSCAYGPMKAALLLFTQNMAVEWGRSGVRVNAVSPGTTLTPRVIDRLKRGGRYVARPEDFSALGRLVAPAEVAAPIAFLLSDDAGAITGVNLPVDAGMLPGLGWALFGGAPPART